MGSDRQDKALREFKHILQDLVFLFRTSTGAETAYLCWVNKLREQFVWETDSTVVPNIMFHDRIQFDHFYLNEYKDITEPVLLTTEVDIPKASLKHYFDFVPVNQVVLIPFVNKGETVAITVLESEKVTSFEKIQNTILAYNNALVNVLNTYLEVVDLHEEQKEWEEYEQILNLLDYKMHRVDLIKKSLDSIQGFLSQGGASFITKGMDSWNVVMNSEGAVKPLSLGLQLEEKSLCYEALEKGESIFAMHFNNTPKRVSSKEKLVEGASYAIPVLINDRRQGVIVAFDQDPLVFKEAVKHKMSNLGRITSLNIQSVGKKSADEDLFTNQYGAFIPDLWEKTINCEVKRTSPNVHTWFGLISPENLSSLRTRFRLDDLHRLQKDTVSLLNPSNFGINGYVGFNSDYVYTFIIQSEQEDAVEQWLSAVHTQTNSGITMSDGNNVEISFKAGYTLLNPEYSDCHEVLTAAKKALDNAVKNEEATLVQI